MFAVPKICVRSQLPIMDFHEEVPRIDHIPIKLPSEHGRKTKLVNFYLIANAASLSILFPLAASSLFCWSLPDVFRVPFPEMEVERTKGSGRFFGKQKRFDQWPGAEHTATVTFSRGNFRMCKQAAARLGHATCQFHMKSGK